MKTKTFIILLTCTLVCMLFSSCQGKEDPEFISSTTIGLKIKDKVIFEYDQLTWQNAFNREKCEFRVHTDNMSDYYTISLNLVPTAVDQKAKGDITWTSKSSIMKKTGLTFVVKKVDRSGRLWLWCKKEQIGVTVQILD